MITMDKVKIGDVVYIHGYYTADTTVPPRIITAEVYGRKNNQWVARGIGDSHGDWHFSKIHYNNSVFLDKESAVKALEEKIANKSWF